MGDLLIRNIPKGLKQELSEVATETGRSMSEEVKTMIRKGLEAYRAEKSKNASINAFEELRTLFAPYDEESEQFANIMDEIERGRKTDFVRPFSFEE